MSLSRKNFVELARILGVTHATEATIKSVVAYCRSENERFSEKRFRDAIANARSC
jgi:hypothetical protein